MAFELRPELRARPESESSMRSPGRALALLILLHASGGLPPAEAQPGWTETRPADAAEYEVVSIEIEGNTRIPSSDLLKELDSSDSKLLRKKRLEYDVIDRDVQRLRSHYFRRGFWEVLVERVVAYEESTKHARVTFRIREGIQHKVGVITTEGNRAFAADEIFTWVELETGDEFDLDQASRDRAAIENTYANRGYFHVAVVADVQRANAPGDPVVNDLVFRITEGMPFKVGDITIKGNEITQDDVIRRELRIESGQPLSRDKVEESRTNLYATGYFSRVELLPEQADSTAGTVDVSVNLIERKMRYVGFGLGYGTQDQFRLSTEWGHRNFLGRGKRVLVRGVLATELLPFDLVRTRLEASYVEPWLFGTRTTGTVDVAFERSREFFRDEDTQEREEYQLETYGVKLNVNRRIARATRTWVTLENEWADIDAEPGVTPPDDVQPDVTRSLTITTERDRRDNYFDPTAGFLNRIIATVSGGILGGDNDYWKLTAESSWYRPFKGVVLAGRIRVGTEEPYGESEAVPDRDRFKIGGVSTVRGYREQDIGPGDFLLLGNFEVRVPIVWILDAGFFMDAGNAWPEAVDVSWGDFSLLDPKDDPARAATNDVRYSVGTGLRVETPVGPVRVDYGYKLKVLPVPPGVEEEDRWRIHLSLGHVF
jgi:outer membrane protein insertion porin family